MSSVDRHGVLSILMTVSELIAASVDRQGVTSLSVAYVGGHGVTVTMLVSSVETHGVLPLLLTDVDVTAACVD